MPNKLKRDVQKTVKAHCANFTGADGCLLGGTCRYWHELMDEEEIHRCAYAEDAVLPNAPVIEMEYHDKLAQYLGETDTPQRDTGKCRDCKKDYVRRSNRQVRCPECQAKARRKTLTDAKRKYRQSKRA